MDSRDRTLTLIPWVSRGIPAMCVQDLLRPFNLLIDNRVRLNKATMVGSSEAEHRVAKIKLIL
jgi:hypothetical protein